MSNEQVPMVSAPTNLSRQLHKLGSADKRMLAVLAALTMFVALRFGSVLFFITLGVSLYLLSQAMWCKRYYQIGLSFFDMWIKQVLQDYLWLSETALQEIYTDSPRSWKQRLSHRFRFSANKVFPLRVDYVEDIGLIWNDRRKSYSLILGSEGSDIAAMSENDQAAMHSLIATSIRRVAAFEQLQVVIGTVVRSRPYNIRQYDASNNAVTHPDVFFPEALKKLVMMGKTIDDLDELFAEELLTKEEVRELRLHSINTQSRVCADDFGKQVDMVMVVTVSKAPGLRAVAKGSRVLTREDLSRELLYQISLELQRDLTRATVHKPWIYNREQCELYLRTAHDVVNLEEYFAQLADVDVDPEATRPGYKPELSVITGDKHVVFDQTGHAVIQITEHPIEIEPSATPRSFTEPNVQWLSRAFVSETSTGNQEYRALYFATAWIDNTVGGLRLGAKSIMRREKLGEDHERLARQRHNEYFNVYLSTASGDPTQLEVDVNEMLRVIRANGGNAIRVSGRSRLPYVAMTAATGIPLL